MITIAMIKIASTNSPKNPDIMAATINVITITSLNCANIFCHNGTEVSSSNWFLP